MKKIINIVLLSLIGVVAYGQNNMSRMGAGLSPDMDEHEHHHQQDSTQQKQVKHLRYTYKWKRDGVIQEIVPIDSTQDGLHNYSYIFNNSISNTILGNYPSPYESDIFILRPEEENFYQLTSVRAFLFKPVDLLNYNTTTPFTQLKYTTGGGKGKNETTLDVFHAQNISPFWDAGFRYNLISSDGRYMNQKAKAYNVSFFSSYERDRYAATFFINQNNGTFNENGGVSDKSFIRDSTENAEDIPVNLGSGVRNKYRNFNFAVMGQYNMGKARERIVNKDTTLSYPARIIANFSIEDNLHRFRENMVYGEFFPITYLDSVKNVDSQYNTTLRASGKLVLNEHPRFKGIPGVYAGLSYQRDRFKENVSYSVDTLADNNGTYVAQEGVYNRNNVFATFGLFDADTLSRFNYDAEGALSFIGDYIGNFYIDGNIKYAFDRQKTNYIHADGRLELKTPSPYFSRYISNHFIWENDFKDIKTISAKGKYVNKKYRNEVGVGFNNLYGYIYLDTLSLPQQQNDGIVVLTSWIKQNFRLGKFFFDQTVYWQYSSDKEVLDLPLIAVYSHNYYKDIFFKGALKFQVGFDMFYNTAFYADNYSPSLMQFHNQRTEKTGNYPKFDVFATFGIRRADLFVKYEHVNYFFTNGEYFSALDYPINPAVFKFGLRWNFFD